MKGTIVRMVSTELREEIGNFEQIKFEKNNEIFILPIEELISRAASKL